MSEFGPLFDPTEFLGPMIDEILTKRKQGIALGYHVFDNCMAMAEQKWDSLGEDKRKELFCFLMTYSAISGVRLAQHDKRKDDEGTN